MSPVNDSRLSSSLSGWIILLITLFTAVACLPSRRPTGTSMISDRLVNLLIQQQLPLGNPESPLRGEVQRCGEWVRKNLETNPATTFRLDPDDNRITAIPSGSNRMLVPELSIRLYRLNVFFQSNAGVPRSIFTEESIRKLLLHPVSEQSIRKMVKTDAGDSLSETGGIVLADPDAGILTFLIIEPDNARWLKELRNIDSFDTFAIRLQKVLPDLPWLNVRARRTLEILKESPGTGETTKQDAIDSFMDLLTYYTRYSYILSQGTQYAAIADMDIQGIYLGVFHVHPPDNPPSPEDRIGSLLRKNFVLVPRDTEIEIHVLDFSANPAAEPFVIRIPSDPADSGSVEPVESYPSEGKPTAPPEPLETGWDDTGSKRETT